MLFVIDAGNTNIVGGLYEGRRLLHTLRIHTVHKKTEDEYSTIFRSILADRGVDPASVDSVVLSSVVPTLTGSLVAMCRHLFGGEPFVLGPSLYPCLPLEIPSPREIGSDLVADALAAWTKTGGASIVVDFGTALTFTSVGAAGPARGAGDAPPRGEGRGAILGVAIAPGLGTAVNALSRDTAQLPFVQLSAPPSVIGTDTVSAIQAGVVHGYAGLVQHLVTKMKEEMVREGRAPELGRIKVIATGGLCRIVAPLVSVFDLVDPDLTLDGLALVAERC